MSPESVNKLRALAGPDQTCHIQVNGKAWCRCSVDHNIWLNAPRHMLLSCSHHFRSDADAMVEYLRTVAKMPAVVVDGPCRQQYDD